MDMACRREPLTVGNCGHKEDVTAMDIGSSLQTSAERDPEKAAIVFESASISYKQLQRETTSLALWLLRQGRNPGDRIVIFWPNSLEAVKLILACFKAGMMAVPVDVWHKAPELAYVLQHSRATMCFAHPDLAAVANEATKGCALSLALRTGLEAWNKQDPEVDLPEVNDDAPALLLYTSGTTARPKGVTHTHRTLLEIVTLISKAAPDCLRTMLVMSPMAYISGVAFGLLPAILAGGTCVLVRSFDPPLVLDLIERFRCTANFGVPAMVQLLVEEQMRKPRDVGSLGTFIVGGDSVPVSTQERFRELFGIPLREGYAMTETGPSICNPVDAIRPGSLGKALDGVEVRVVDADGNETPDGKVGEIAVRSPANCAGYWDDPVATRAALREGWLYSGDLARRDGDGYFWFEGRKKEIIVREGFNISPQEVEEAIHSHPTVLEVAVIGLPDPVTALGERILAFVVLREGLMAHEHELRDHARQRLADIKVPEKIVFLKSLPKGITGKIQRRALKEKPPVVVA
jgi:long-chain acyl-CoA synthetase